MDAKTIAIANRKGGAARWRGGKLGIGLRDWEKVLLIGADLQGGFPKSLALREPDTIEIALANCIKGIIEGIVLKHYGMSLEKVALEIVENAESMRLRLLLGGKPSDDACWVLRKMASAGCRRTRLGNVSSWAMSG